MQTISLKPDDYPKCETYRVSSKEFAEELLRMWESPVCSTNDCRTLGRLPAKEMPALFSQDELRKLSVSNKIRTEYDPLHNEYIFYTIQEMSRVPHPRFEKPCENCGANDWRPIFKRVYARKGHKLTHYICEYCGTRRNEYELYSLQ